MGFYETLFQARLMSMPFRAVYSYGCLYPKFRNGDLSFGSRFAKRSTGTAYFATMLSIYQSKITRGSRGIVLGRLYIKGEMRTF